MLTGSLVGIAWIGGVQPAELGLRWQGWATLCWQALAFSIFLIGLDEAGLAVRRAHMPRAGRSVETLAETVGTADRFTTERASEVGLLFMTSALWEELCFRGVAGHYATHYHLPLQLTIAVSTLIFAVQHVASGGLSVAYSGLYGLIFSAMFVVSGSVYPVAIAHAIGNGFVVFVTLRKRCERIADKHLDFF